MIRWLIVRWLQWEAIMLVQHTWRHRREVKDAFADLFFGAWAELEFPEFYGLLREGQRLVNSAVEDIGPDLDDWYVVRHGFPQERLEALQDHPRLGRYARYAVACDGYPSPKIAQAMREGSRVS